MTGDLFSPDARPGNPRGGHESAYPELVQLLAAFGGPLGKTKVQALAKRVGLRSPGGRPLTGSEVDRDMARLVKLGLLRRDAHIACAPEHALSAFLEAVRSHRIVSWREALLELHAGRYYYRHPASDPHVVGLLRLALCSRLPAARIDEVLRRAQSSDRDALFRAAFAAPFDPELIAAVAQPHRDRVLDALLSGALHRPYDGAAGVFAYALRRSREPDASIGVILRTAEHALWRNRFEDATALLATSEHALATALLAASRTIAGDHVQALALRAEAQNLLLQQDKSRFGRLPRSIAWLHVVSLMASDTPAALAEAQRVCRGEARADRLVTRFWEVLEHMAAARRGDQSAATGVAAVQGRDALTDLVVLLAKTWLRQPLQKGEVALLERWLDAHRAAGFEWLAREIEAGLAIASGVALDAELGRTLMATFAAEQPCRRAVAALAALGANGASAQRETRIAWMLKPGDYDKTRFVVEARIQTRGARGWNRGTRISFAKLKRTENLAARDVLVARNIERVAGNIYELDPDLALPALVGHPLVFFAADPATPVELVAAEPELIVERHRGGVRVRLEPDPRRSQAHDEPGISARATGHADPCVLVRKSPTRAAVVRLTAAHRRAAEHIGSGLEVPAEGVGDLNHAIAAVAHLFDVHSEVQAAVPEVEADRVVRAELAPAGEGLRVRFAVRPFGDHGSTYTPGVGGTRVIAEVKGERRAALRDLAAERAAVARVLDAVPMLDGAGGDFEWRLDDPESCLELVERLQALPDLVRVEWPEGAKFRVSRAYRADDLRVTVKSARDWFAVSGELALDDGKVLDMRRLIELARHHRGRYVPLGDAGFVALTDDLRRRLDELVRAGDFHADGVRVSAFAADTLAETLEGTRFEPDAAWRTRLARLEEVAALTVEPSSTLQAELRPYQVDGFRWLARLAHWGGGACLADDMGLGKTVQALALLLRRTSEGAALVVAPTSVCANWVTEAARFAPTLRVFDYHGGDRAAVLRDAGSYDLVVCSYALLQQDIDAFRARSWHTLVLDEAQAVKNFATKRAQAVLELEAGFRLVTTGTPVENRLDELWMLFRFLNPGLLGTRDQFNARFALPIERHQDNHARTHLRRLIRPFVLRRTKAEVLTELPDRTEISLAIECTDEERAFREALRQHALAVITSGTEPAERQRFRVLAELMRMRRACCDPRLVTPDVTFPGAKLDTFAELAQELVANHHKALVFSQFVDFLALLRERLDALGFGYQYLDGGTPAADRARRVAAFQAGEGSFFLISLRAGGFGLNLTAADYVIIADPWWNPAVEDQAAGRAHRMGQQRPVTVYRLVAKGSIEERIMELHRDKRALAEGLFGGEEFGRALSVEELTRLLQEMETP